ncbi:hypothetical protein Igag_0714 [Ignisphaera aggregans DSM 17230]|uniref:Piwi domain-containing protein n=1 Tax=Ignisphaera aggregans (strain DSM 17230 / JCM 13409 / AQ1.S1) TaxID=583356 RepID=E0ST67_IGNAA|nr:hypothetical protein Igag_0714 [Ignisphaera aggregans DSM 17230]
MVFPYESLTLNGIRSEETIELDSFECFEATLKCDYSECKRRLHGLFIDMLLDGKPTTYELVKLTDGCLAKLYVKDVDTLNNVKERLKDILKGELKRVEGEKPSYFAIETFFDLLVDAALREAGFKYLGQGKFLDPNDPSKYLKKRTIIEIVETSGTPNEKYHGILFIDYGIVNQRTLADELLEKLGIDDFHLLRDDEALRKKCLELAHSYEGSSVLTLMGTDVKYVYGEITGVEPSFSRDIVLPNGQTIYNLWIERFRKNEVVKRFVGTEPSEWEYPLFKVRIFGRDAEFTYPPSLLRIFGVPQRPDPSTRWDNIVKLVRIVEENIKRIYENLTGKSIHFKYIKYKLSDTDAVGIKLNFYTGSNYEKVLKNQVVKLRYKDKNGNEKPDYASPIVAFSSRGLMPYAGKIKLILTVIYPSSLKIGELKEFVQSLQSYFSNFNLGDIEVYDHECHSYSYDPANLSESLTSLERTIQKTLEVRDPHRYFPLIIIPDNEKFYKASKEVASMKGFHSQLVNLDTFNKTFEYIKKIKELEKRNPKAKERKTLENALGSLLSEICGGIYAEFLIQKSKNEGSLSGPLTWILDKPADQEGKSMYVGLDVSTKKGVAGAAFILLDPYGKLIDAKIISLRTETLSYDDYYEILRYMVSMARDRGLTRIVILRDGVPKSPDEIKGCLDAFNVITRELRYNASLDYVAVIKDSNVRIFAGDKGFKTNPIQGTYVYLYRMKHLGYYAHEVLVVASRPEESEEESPGTVRPIILRIYEMQRKYSKDDVKKIAEEYLSLTRLNFWNLRTGTHKLALPIKMAHILAYMLSMGIPVKVT